MSPSHGERDHAAHRYDAVLILSFGGPEGPEQVMPFLENVTRGRGVPRERLEKVAEHYYLFGGVSPINAQNRALVEALSALLSSSGPQLPVYWGNRNWHPFIEDTLATMRDDGIRRAITFVTSAFSSYSACRQYREDILRAQVAVGEGAPVLDKLRHFFNHPGFIEPQVENVQRALEGMPIERRRDARLVFTAHSIPAAMADTSSYVTQLEEASRLVAEALGRKDEWDLVYQSRSGSPRTPWLEPDVCDHLEDLSKKAIRDVVLVPIGFVSDHLEIAFDLDIEAKEKAKECSVGFVRAATVGTHPRFVEMIRELITERTSGASDRVALGDLGASHDVCAHDCCVFEGMRPVPVA
jgi:protoporphyrin/coproporphyrin ferrochelatase